MENYSCKNGVQIIIVPNKSLRSISTSVTFGVGLYYENKSIAGVSHVVEHLMCKDKILQKRLDMVGAVLSGSTYKETTNYILLCLDNEFAEVFSTFVRTLFQFGVQVDKLE